MRKLVAIICFLLVFLSGCSSERSDYNKGVKAYESEDYQSALDIFKTLGNYKDSTDYLVKATQGVVESAIDEFGDSIENQTDLTDFIVTSTYLTREQFSEIPNASKFEELFISYIDGLGKQAKWDKALDSIQDVTMISEECTKTCLESYGRWACIESAESYVKARLKSPKSYYRYSASVSTPQEREEYYIVNVYLKYGATNGFGGEVTSNEQIVVHFVIDLDSRTVQFDCIGNASDLLSDALKNAGF